MCIRFSLLSVPRRGPPPDLRSFPTRRSSDLPAVMERVASDLARIGVELLAVEVRDLMVPGELKRVFAGDRKSTRLNSSHLVISYAVFCLKKKKKYAP